MDRSSSLQCPEPVAHFSTPQQPLGSLKAPHSFPPQGLYVCCSLCLEWSSSGYLANSKLSSGNEQMPSKNLLLTPDVTEPLLVISGSLFSTPSEHKQFVTIYLRVPNLYINMFKVLSLIRLQAPMVGAGEQHLQCSLMDPQPRTEPDLQENFSSSCALTFIKALLLILNSYPQYLRCWGRCWDGGPECIKVIMGKFGDYSWRYGAPSNFIETEPLLYHRAA